MIAQRKTARGDMGVLAVGALLVAGVIVAGCERHEHGTPAGGADMPPQAGMEVAQKICPVMGMPINESIFVDHGGRRVYFCCTDCISTFKADPEKYLKKLDGPAAEGGAIRHESHEGHDHRH